MMTRINLRQLADKCEIKPPGHLCFSIGVSKVNELIKKSYKQDETLLLDFSGIVCMINSTVHQLLFCGTNQNKYILTGLNHKETRDAVISELEARIKRTDRADEYFQYFEESGEITIIPQGGSNNVYG